MNQRELHSTITDLTLLTNTLRMRRDALKLKVKGLEKRVKTLERENQERDALIRKLATPRATVTSIHESGYLTDVTA